MQPATESREEQIKKLDAILSTRLIYNYDISDAIDLYEAGLRVQPTTMDETALLKATKVLWDSVIQSAGSTLTWEEAQQEHRHLSIEHARRAIMTYLDSVEG